MAVDNFNSKTFVAFVDISGFKVMMKDNGGEQAILALDSLYSAGYDALESNDDISGFFISDCGILFVNNEALKIEEKLLKILKVVKKINKKLLKENLMLTTSIAYGSFRYDERTERVGVEKNAIYGEAYVTAFMDNENGKPKLEPGQCRIVIDDVEEGLESIDTKLKKVNKHLYYYWMVDKECEIEDFNRRYKDSYQLKYKGILSALKMKND